jgi:RNA polymerase sigma-70 factor (ECF subfamily)
MTRFEHRPSVHSQSGSRLASLYAAHAEDVRRWVPAIVGPSVDAEDVVHEVFIVVQRRLDEFRGDAKFATWLFRITTFVALRQLRKQRTQRLELNLADDFVSEVASPDPTPYEWLEQKRTALEVRATLGGLDPKQRDTLLLFELDGCNGEEIADITSTKLPTVWVRLHRGRARFRERMCALRASQEPREAEQD